MSKKNYKYDDADDDFDVYDQYEYRRKEKRFSRAVKTKSIDELMREDDNSDDDFY